MSYSEEKLCRKYKNKRSKFCPLFKIWVQGLILGWIMDYFKGIFGGSAQN
jgi:hypothetical protein